jgi:hypothetical protein
MIVERVTFFGVQIKLLTYDLLKAVRYSVPSQQNSITFLNQRR